MTVAPPPAKRVLAALLAALIGVTLADVPAQAAEPEPHKPAKPQVVPSVPVTTVKSGKAPAIATPPDASKRPAPVWPAPTQTEADVPGAPAARDATPKIARVGGTPVSVGKPAGAGDAPGRVRVQVLDRAATSKAGVRGVLLRVGRADTVAKSGPLDVTVDYKPFRNAYGADWATRLRLLALPECALTSPERRACAGTPLPSRNDATAGTVSARVLATATGGLFALEAGSSGAAGDYAATSLQPSATWSAGGSSGDFSWSYPMRVPPAVGGPAPQVGLTYSSQSVDGRNVASNNQPSWVGEGFEAWPGFIERRYVACADDMDNGANNTEETGDLCWATGNATLSLGASSGELIYNATEQRWHLRKDDGTRVEVKTGAENGDNAGEHWVVTTPDGMQYWFGLNKLPGAGDQRTESTWTVPVYGNHPDEPCHKSSFATSSCDQAYRWNLDYVVDVRGNSASYWYAKETNNYGRNHDSSDVAAYTRGGHLRHIAYGTRKSSGVDSVFGSSAPARVVFGTADRCLSSCGDDENWPDVPRDQECTGTTCDTYSPTFWSTKRLSTITTQVWGGSGYRDVERWTLHHTFPDPGDTTRAGLWLSKISHTGLVGSAASLPDVEFTPVQLANRVDPEVIPDHSPAMKWMRIARIRNETGGTVNVTYSAPDCVPGSRMPSAPHSNTLRCYPVWRTPEGYTDPILDWFHKYVVTTIFEIDHTGGVPPFGSPPVEHRYTYIGNPAWHYADDDGLVEPKEKTWSVWRGYERVGVTNGAVINSTTTEQTYVETKYLRGMHGDKLPSGSRSVPVTGAGVPTVNDEDAYAGLARETVTYNRPGGPEISRQVYEPWQSEPTATRTINGDTVDARFVNVAATHDRVVLDAGRGTRVSTSRSTFDAYGKAVEVESAGDLAVTGDESCTKTTYEPRNTAAWLLNSVHRVQTFALPCDETDDPAALTDDDVISDRRTWFDGNAWGTVPTGGLQTREEEASAWNAGNPTYVTVRRAEYDIHGRTTKQWDAVSQPTTIAYTPVTGGPVTGSTTTNALNHVTTNTIEPAWGTPVSTVDANGKVTDLAYDGLGRLTSVWMPGQDKANENPNAKYSYETRTDAPSVVTTSNLNARGEYVTSYAFYDGLLRTRQLQTGSPQGGRLISDTFYDTAGNKVKEYTGYYNSTPPNTTLVGATEREHVPNQTRAVFDGAGRATASVFQPYNAERWRTTTYFAGDRTDVTPPDGGTVTSTVMDALGRTVELRQYHGRQPTGAFDKTTYEYNRKGQMTLMRDVAGNEWTFEHDLRGNLVKSTDPDRGETTNTFDDAGRVKTTTDGRGEKLAYQYDALGRKIGLFDDQVSASPRARWQYDAVAKGALSQTTRYINGAQYVVKALEYSDHYLPKKQQVIIPSAEAGLNGTYQYEASYNVDGSLASSTFPQSGDLGTETLTYHYDEALGMANRLTTILGTEEFSYVSNVDYSPLGALSQLHLYRGLYSKTGSEVTQTFTHEIETGRLASIKTERQLLSPYTVADVRYNYDDAGNVTKIADVAAPGGADNQCFEYDYLRRLDKAWTPANGDCAATPTVAGLGGPAKYWLSWSHGTVGNREKETDHAAASGARTTNYAYPPARAARPHALTSTSVTVGSTTTPTGAYTYDNVGNTLTRPTASSGTQTLTWDSEGQLETSTDTTGVTRYIYDADGNRLIRRDPTGKTLYLAGQEIRFNGSTATRTCTRYYTFGAQTVASRTAAGLSWLTSDQQGTAQIAINEATQQATIRRQTPYGTPRGTSSAWPNTKGFVGGTVDNTGLTHLGAREYDAGTGRFISVDPVQDPSDPQQWNGYAYSNNNPTTYSDPSGLKWDEETGEEYNQRMEEHFFEQQKKIEQQRLRDPGRITDGNAHAHDTAIALRVLDLQAMYPGALITANQTASGGADLVCWNCAAIATGGKAKEVWVWEFKSVGTSDAEAKKSLDSGIAWAQADPLAGGRTVVAGPKFPHERKAVVPNVPNQVVTVYSDTRPDVQGVERYEVREYNQVIAKSDWRRMAGDRAVEAAVVANKRSERIRSQITMERGVVDDPVSGWGIAIGVGVVTAAAVWTVGPAVLGGIGGGLIARKAAPKAVKSMFELVG